MAKDSWRDQPRWPKGTRDKGGQWRDTKGGSGGSWVSRLLDRFGGGGDAPAGDSTPDQTSMGEVQRRVAAGESLEVKYGGDTWHPVKSSEIGEHGQIVTKAGDLILRHNPQDMLQVREGRLTGAARLTMGDVQRRVARGEKLDIEYGGTGRTWKPVASSEIGEHGQIVTRTARGGGFEPLELQHSSADVLNVRPAAGHFDWADQIVASMRTGDPENLERMDAVAQERGANLDPSDSHAVGTRVTDPFGGEGRIARRYRRGGLEMATVEYDGAPGEEQDWEIADLTRR